jgi:hypothetical protein
MKTAEKNVKTTSVPTRSTYTTDCFRKVTDKETGVTEVKRWVEERQVNANLQTCDGGVFHNGARVA